MSTPAPVIYPSMESPDGKLGWAKTHADILQNQIRVFENRHPYTIRVEDDTQTRQYVFKVQGIGPVDPDWSYMFGDIVHNLRSALDHLVYQLAILGQGRRLLTDDEVRSCLFPIYDDLSRIPNPSKSGPIKLLRSGEQTRILELQPFNAMDPSIWGLSNAAFKFTRVGGALLPIWLRRLADYDNIDKHRTVNIAWQVAKWFEAAPIPPQFISSTISGNALEDDAEVGRWSYGSPQVPLPAGVDMKRYFPIGVAFGDPPAMISADEQLTLMTRAVEIVVELFRPCIEIGAAPLPISSISM